MTWGAVAGAAIGVVGSSLNSNSNGGAGTQTQSKEPWAAAQPWIMNNLQQGQNLQNAYTAQPFSQAQQTAYGNMGAQSDYMRSAVPSLLGQLSGQQVGFDRSNPNARPQAFNFNNLMSAAGAGQQGALAGLTGNRSGVGSMQTPQAAPQAQGGGGLFVNQSAPPAGNYMAPKGSMPNVQGSYGAFQYGQMPQPGTQAETDLRMYLAMGGADPQNLYAQYRPQGGYGGLLAMGGVGSADANSSGSATGAAASDGGGGGTAF